MKCPGVQPLADEYYPFRAFVNAFPTHAIQKRFHRSLAGPPLIYLLEQAVEERLPAADVKFPADGGVWLPKPFRAPDIAVALVMGDI